MDFSGFLNKQEMHVRMSVEVIRILLE